MSNACESDPGSSKGQIAITDQSLRSFVIGAALLDSSLVSFALMAICACLITLILFRCPFVESKTLIDCLCCSAVLLPWAYDRLFRFLSGCATPGEYAMGLRRSIEDRKYLARRWYKDLGLYALPAAGSIFACLACQYSPHVFNAEIEWLVIILGVTFPLIYFFVLAAVRIRAKLSELSAIGPPLVAAIIYQQICSTQKRRTLIANCLFVLPLLFWTCMYFNDPRYVTPFFNHPLARACLVLFMNGMIAGYPLVKYLRFSGTAFVFFLLFVCPTVLLTVMAPAIVCSGTSQLYIVPLRPH